MDNNFYNRILYFLKIGIASLLVIILSTIAVLLIINAKNFNTIIKNVSESSLNAKDIAKEFKETSISIKDTSKTIKEVAELNKQELTDPQAIRARRLLYQSGDNIYRLILKADHTLDIINSSTIPKVDHTIVTLDTAIANADRNIAELMKTFIAFIESNRDIAVKLQLLLDNPNIPLIMEQLAKTLGSTDSLVKEAKVTVQDFNRALPDLLKLLTETNQNIVNGTGKVTDILEEIRKFAVEVNKKDPRYIRALRFVLQAAIGSLPVLLKR